MTHNLFEVMKTAKNDIGEAKESILRFVQEKFSNLQAISIDINDSKVSLNSVNGFVNTQDSKRYFFKFHTEEGEETTINEYYQSRELSEAGLPIIKPIHESTEPGSQFLIYEEIEALTAFEEFEKLEETPSQAQEEKLLAAEERLLTRESQVFLDTLEVSKATDIVNTPLYQLFHTRLVSKNNEPPRLDIYYTGQNIELPGGKNINFNDLSQKKWIINGVNYSETLANIINNAKKILDPLKNTALATVLGHGDDHNGNKFNINGEFVFFDPAFAGRQPALLSFIKATAHNTFLHPNWLYDPKKIQNLEFNYGIQQDSISIDHNWDMEQQSPVRKKLLDLQVKKVWQPLLQEMRKRNILPKNYEEYIQKALFCCPFLVYNLIDKDKYSPVTSLLALSKCVELGSKGDKENYVSKFLKELQ